MGKDLRATAHQVLNGEASTDGRTTPTREGTDRLDRNVIDKNAEQLNSEALDALAYQLLQWDAQTSCDDMPGVL